MYAIKKKELLTFVLANIFFIAALQAYIGQSASHVCLPCMCELYSPRAEIAVCRHRTAVSLTGWLSCLDEPSPGTVLVAWLQRSSSPTRLFGIWVCSSSWCIVCHKRMGFPVSWKHVMKDAGSACITCLGCPDQQPSAALCCDLIHPRCFSAVELQPWALQ